MLGRDKTICCEASVAMVKLTKKEETPFLAAPFHPAHLFVLHRGAAVQFAAKSSLDRLRRRMKAAGTGVEGGKPSSNAHDYS